MVRLTRANVLPALRRFFQAYGFYAALFTLILLFSVSAVFLRASRGARAALPNAPRAEASATAPAADESPVLLFPCGGDLVTAYDGKLPVWFAPLRVYQIHAGVDFGLSIGDEVYCCMDGRVAKVHTDALYGLSITVEHADGRESVYASLTQCVVRAGEKVRAGQVIALAGDTSPLETELGPHLHFEWRENGVSVCPPFANLPDACYNDSAA